MRQFIGVIFICIWGISGCAAGYMKTADLERQKQGPSHCAARCKELGMQMGALVLVSNQLPGCVCQMPSTTISTAEPGASATAMGQIVLAAAAAARHQQKMHQQMQMHQQSQLK